MRHDSRFSLSRSMDGSPRLLVFRPLHVIRVPQPDMRERIRMVARSIHRKEHLASESGYRVRLRDAWWPKKILVTTQVGAAIRATRG